MKKTFFTLILVVAIVAGFIGFYAWKNFRGAGSAFFSLVGDSAKLFKQKSTDQTSIGKTAGAGGASPLTVARDFDVSLYADGLLTPRDMIFGPSGDLLVSLMKEGKIVGIRDSDSDGVAEKRITIAENLNQPHGLALDCGEESCTLYVAETDRVTAFDMSFAGAVTGAGRAVAQLPRGGRHFTRSLLIPAVPNDGRLLISVGSSCDVCDESDGRYASIQAVDIRGGGGLAPFATGLRNSVFMTLHPVTGDVWATEMGRDYLGDDLPPDEINIIREGGDYGWPNCYGKNIHDAEFDKKTHIRNPCMEPFETPSHIDLPAHSAPLGLAFIPEEGWPQQYWHNLLVSYHGSWNRSEPTGFKVARFILDNQGDYIRSEDFISGWLVDGGALGRPVDILSMPSGIIYISDDKAGVIYRVSYRGAPVSENGAGGTSDELISVSIPQEGSLVTSPLSITGQARGYWYFEASFPIELYDGNNKRIGSAIAQAKGEWMTEDFVPFFSELEFDQPSTSDGYVLLKRDNPSGLPEHDRSVKIPVRFN